jgi:recombination protein RecR
MAEPASLVRLTEELERLPGVGPRTAERLAHHLLRVPEERALALADAIREARRRIRPCPLCRAPSEREPCPTCADPGRDRSLLMVVASARDLAALEAPGRYRGLYFVLGGALSPLEGVDAGALDLDGLRRRAADGQVREVIVATNPDLEGDGTALLVARAAKDAGVAVTRLARGLPAGGQIEHQSAAVLADAFDGRRPV